MAERLTYIPYAHTHVPPPPPHAQGETPEEKAECRNWLFWQMGSAPYLGGGFGHFFAYAPVKIEYAIDRFAMEVSGG